MHSIPRRLTILILFLTAYMAISCDIIGVSPNGQEFRITQVSHERNNITFTCSVRNSSIVSRCYLEIEEELGIRSEYEPTEVSGNVFYFKIARLELPENFKFRYVATNGKDIIETDYVDYINDIILFEDPIVEDYCVSRWDTDHDHLLSKREAAEVKMMLDRLPDGAKHFNEYKYFTGLDYYTIHNPGTRNIFKGHTDLIDITIPESIQVIEEYAFAGCTSLEYITIDHEVFVNPNAFQYTPSLKAFKGEGFGITEDGKCFVRNGILCGFASNGLTAYTTPDMVLEVPDYAFYDISLKEITFGFQCQSFGESIFWGSSVEKVVFKNILELPAHVFDGCDRLKTVEFPTWTKSIVLDNFTRQTLTDIYLPCNIPPKVTIETHVFPCRAKIHIPKGYLSEYKSAWDEYLWEFLVDDIFREEE